MRNVVVDVFLVVGVAAELICVIGVTLMPTIYDRLHYAAAGTTIGPFAILVALLVREGFSTQGFEAVAAVAILFVINPVVVHAIARAARRVDFGRVEALPEERAP
jgi:monovalent cation/proton antiporter MnhG/PhaG subunit